MEIVIQVRGDHHIETPLGNDNNFTHLVVSHDEEFRAVTGTGREAG
jgi:hypothetical protein